MEEAINRVLDWALTGTGGGAFSNGDALAVLQILILLYAFRDRIFARVSLRQIDARAKAIESQVSSLAVTVNALGDVGQKFDRLREQFTHLNGVVQGAVGRRASFPGAVEATTVGRVDDEGRILKASGDES